MSLKKLFLLSSLVLLQGFSSFARLEYDSKANKIQLYGPYLKYNILKEPYSFSRYQFNLRDFKLSTEINSDNPEDLKIYASWPRFFMSFGEIRILLKDGREVYEESFEVSQTGEDEKFARFHLQGEDSTLLQALNEPFHICMQQEFESSEVKVCSNFYTYTDGSFNAVETKDLVKVALLNGKDAPKNAQISIPTNGQTVQIELGFNSGFTLIVKDRVRAISLKNLMIDPKEKRISIVSGDGSVRPTQLTIKDRFFSFIKENNYFKNQYVSSSPWPQDIEDAEMEFAPYETGASAFLYGIIIPHVPPPFNFGLAENSPIATYTDKITLEGTKDEKEILAAKVRNQLYIHENKQDFRWVYPTEEAGTINQNYLSLQYKKKDYYFSTRIFRAHKTAVSGSFAISTSQTLDVVPGYNFTAEHWFEEIWGDGKWSKQRWGLAANIYETAKPFKPAENFPENISINPTNFDILFRLTQGVRPVQRSFGLGLRFLNFKLFRSVSSDLETRYLGVGAFWHTAPQKIIDDIFNIVPIFRYPKWMEISFFYYPLLLGPEQLGFSFSWQARGKMFFSRSWYLDASFNVNNISFKRSKLAGVTQGADAFGIGTAHGTIGVGYLFN